MELMMQEETIESEMYIEDVSAFQNMVSRDLPTDPYVNCWVDDRYFVNSVLGEGGFGTVYLVFDKLNEQYYALKTPKSGIFPTMFNREIEILQRLNEGSETKNESIAELFGSSSNKGTISSANKGIVANAVSYYVTTFANEGDLGTYLIDNEKEFQKGIPEEQVFQMFSQIVDGVDYIHSKGFVHLDLKPDNILLNNQSKFVITDFSLSQLFTGEDGKGNFSNFKGGSKSYWSPEMFGKIPYNGQLSDIYAWGIILFVLTFGWCPFQYAKSDDSLFKRLATNPVEFWKSHPITSRRIAKNTVSPELIELLNFMLCPYPNYRLSLAEVKNHKWYQGYLASENLQQNENLHMPDAEPIDEGWPDDIDIKTEDEYSVDSIAE